LKDSALEEEEIVRKVNNMVLALPLLPASDIPGGISVIEKLSRTNAGVESKAILALPRVHKTRMGTHSVTMNNYSTSMYDS
jgi:hypothetical protein